MRTHRLADASTPRFGCRSHDTAAPLAFALAHQPDSVDTACVVCTGADNAKRLPPAKNSTLRRSAVRPRGRPVHDRIRLSAVTILYDRISTLRFTLFSKDRRTE
jgi:hypothetical protein